MMLTAEDIERIEGLGYRDFFLKRDGFFMLKNVDGKCIFLDENGRCSIYEHRPEGCRYYPMVYDISSKKVVLDNYCPYSREFSLENEEKLRDLAMRIMNRR